MGCHFLLQGIFPTQGSNLGLPHYGLILYHLMKSGGGEDHKLTAEVLAGQGQDHRLTAEVLGWGAVFPEVASWKRLNH